MLCMKKKIERMKDTEHKFENYTNSKLFLFWKSIIIKMDFDRKHATLVV